MTRWLERKGPDASRQRSPHLRMASDPAARASSSRLLARLYTPKCAFSGHSGRVCHPLGGGSAVVRHSSQRTSQEYRRPPSQSL